MAEPIRAALAVDQIRADAMAEAFRDRGGGTADRIIAADRTAMRVLVADAAAVADGFQALEPLDKIALPE